MSADRGPTPDDPVAGRSLEMWERAFANRTARLARLLEFESPAAPEFVISNEIKLLRQALDAIDQLRGLPSLPPEGSC